MGIGPISGGGGRAGGPKGPRGAGKGGGKGAVGRSGGKSFGSLDKTHELMGPSGAAGSDEVGGASGTGGVAGAAGASGAAGTSEVGGAVAEMAAKIARALKSGELASKTDAARALVSGILKERMHLQSKALEKHITEQIEGDPRLSEKLERIWQRGG